MASPANNNSSSSPPIPNRPNPKPRNSEAGDPLRRSFRGNPFPVNSKVNNPSEFTRRNSFGGRENSRLDFSDKENETKGLPLPKGSKNFMSPTISAVSKINPSPRKRVLSGKNEVSRSLSDVEGLALEENKSHHNARSCVSFSDVIHVIGIDEKMRFERPHDMTVTDFDENEVHEDKGFVHSDPRFRISPRPSVPYTSPELADREVEALARPYDPKKNYLSPRPQFLHYKPNPRIECKQLEELFISESSSSDTELSAEESENCEEQEKDDASHEGGTKAVREEETAKESEKCEEQEKYSSHEGGAEAEVEAKTEDVEQLEAEREEEMVYESIEETSHVPKQSSFRIFKFLQWFLALAMTFLLVSAAFSPTTEIFRESPFYEFHIPREITEFAKGNNLEQLSEKLWTLTESSLVYMDKLISCLRAEKEYGPFQFHNLTYTLEDNTVFQPTSVEIKEEPLQEKSRGDYNLEDGYANEFEEESGVEENLKVVFETKGKNAESSQVDEQTEMTPGTDIEVNEGEENLEALVVEWNTEEQRDSEVILPEVNNDAGGLETLEKLETGSSKKNQEEKEAESEVIYINQHDVETAVINQQKEVVFLADVKSGSEESFREIAAETSDDLHPKLQQSEVADAESESEDGFREGPVETSDDLHPKFQQSEVADAESESEDGFREIAAETSGDLHPKACPFNQAMIVLSSTVLVLLAAVAFLFLKKAKPLAASAPEPASEKLNLAHVPVEKLMKEKLTSLNFQAAEEEEEEEVDDRISNSVHKKSSSLSNNKVPKEHQSLGGSSKLRRESMASSASEYSVGSLSYGSFTTYEKIPIKSGDREEEMITPVRRSSRIRNHHQPSGQ